MGTNTTGNDASGDVVGLVAGSGILLFQAAAIIPGLLPVLLLTVAFALPLVAIGVIAAPLIGIPYLLWRAGSWAAAAIASMGAEPSADPAA